jgi:hypothetical protein
LKSELPLADAGTLTGRVGGGIMASGL